MSFNKFCTRDCCAVERKIEEIEAKKELLESARTYMRINKELSRELDRMEFKLR